MNSNDKKRKYFTVIKVISVILISSGIGLELWNTYASITHNYLSASLNPIFWIERFAITIHLVEGMIAAVYASSRKKMPIKYGAYTFFVGTVGLLELFDK
jgi:hypothetical protein